MLLRRMCKVAICFIRQCLFALKDLFHKLIVIHFNYLLFWHIKVENMPILDLNPSERINQDYLPYAF